MIKTKVFEIDVVRSWRAAWMSASDDSITQAIQAQLEIQENAQLAIQSLRSILAERDANRAADAKKIRETQDAAYVPVDYAARETAETTLYNQFLAETNDPVKARRLTREFASSNILDDIEV